MTRINTDKKKRGAWSAEHGARAALGAPTSTSAPTPSRGSAAIPLGASAPGLGDRARLGRTGTRPAGQIETNAASGRSNFHKSGAGAHPTAPEAGALPGTIGAFAPAVATALRCRAALAALALFLASPFAFAAGEFSINSTSAQIQNFDSLGNSTTATLPTGWLMSAAGGGNSSTWTTANQTAINQQASSGAPNTGGRYNWGSNATDRALGFMTSGSYASPNSILYGITNNTGGLVTSIDLAFDYERYRINTAAASVAFSYSPDGTTWTAFASGDSGAFATGNSSYTFGNGTVVSSSFTLSDLNLANAANFYFRWNFNTTGGNSQGIGLDNVSLTLNSGGVPTSFTTWTGTGSPGTWSDGTAGQFGGNYANDLANTVTFAGTGTAVTASGTPQAGSLVFNSDGYSLAGAVQLGVGNITTAAATTTTLSAEISGNASSGITKLGAGTLILSGSNSYTGSTAISAGVLEARHANALGTTAAGTTVSDGATLALSNSIAIGAETLGLSGNGSSSSGALRNLSGTNSISGAVTLNANSRIQSDAGTLTLTGGITGTGRALTIAGAGATTLSSSGLNTSTGGTLLKTDAGTLTISASSSYTGGTSVSGGTITASHNSALGTGAVTITSGTVHASNGITLGNDFTIGAPGAGGSVVTLAGWDFAGLSNYGSSPYAAGTVASNVTVGGLTRAAGVSTNGTAAANGWGGSDMQGVDFATAISANDFITFTLTGNGSNALSIDSIGAYNVRRSGTGPTTGQWQFSTDGTTYTDIGTAIVWGSGTTAAGNAQSSITLNSTAALQNVAGGSTVTFRLALWGASGAGTWYLNNSTVGDDFTLRGTVGSSAATGSATLGLNTAGTATYSGNLTIHGAATLTAAASATATFSGNFSGAGNVTKTGTGTVLLTGNAAHSGGTTVSAGTLLLNGSHASAVTVSTGATLGGNGTISGLATLNSGATLSPGNSVGNLNFNGGLTLAAGSNLVMEINGASSFDTITIAGNSIAYAGTLTLNFDSGYTPVVNQTYQLVTRTGGATASGNFASLAFSNPDYAGSFDTNSGVLTLTAVPEPKTWALLSLGASFLLWQIRRRKNFNHQ
jgi:autotransporter-associated beta strand protein